MINRGVDPRNRATTGLSGKPGLVPLKDPKTGLTSKVAEGGDRAGLQDASKVRAGESSLLNRAVETPTRATTGGVPPPKPPKLPGPNEHFPFGGGGQPMPKPELPNKVYRIMSPDEAAKTVEHQELAPPIKGTEGERFVSLDSDYPMKFREKELADLENKFNPKVDSYEQSLKNIDARLEEMDRQGLDTYDLEHQRQALVAQHRERGLANKSVADKTIREWHAAPGQQVVVEIELEPGALDEMLGKSVDNKHWGEYSKSGKDVFMWKLERGYGRNIGIPKWQIGAFNARIKSVRLYGWKQPLGTAGMRGMGAHGPN